MDTARLIAIPYLTNSKPLVKGEDLLLPLVAQAKVKQQVRRTWRDVRREEMERAKKAKVDNA